MNITQIISESIRIKQQLLADSSFEQNIDKAVDMCVNSLKNNGKILFCGNGGSAADAQHLAAELSGRFKMERKPLDAEALHTNSSFVTAVANDYGFEEIYSRSVEATGRKGDVLFAISTSGNSQNIVNAAVTAKKLGLHVIALTGEGGGKLAGMCDMLIAVPSTDTARIQEIHIMIGHIICELVENKMFG